MSVIMTTLSGKPAEPTLYLHLPLCTPHWTTYPLCTPHWTTYPLCTPHWTTYPLCTPHWTTYPLCTPHWTTYPLCTPHWTTYPLCTPHWTTYPIPHVYEMQKDEVYLNLVLDFVPETVYRVIRHHSKSKQIMPVLYTKVHAYMHAYMCMCMDMWHVHGYVHVVPFHTPC